MPFRTLVVRLINLYTDTFMGIFVSIYIDMLKYNLAISLLYILS